MHQKCIKVTWKKITFFIIPFKKATQNHLKLFRNSSQLGCWYNYTSFFVAEKKVRA